MSDEDKVIEQEWDELKKKYPDAEEITFFMPYEDSRFDDLEKTLQVFEDMKGDQEK